MAPDPHAREAAAADAATADAATALPAPELTPQDSVAAPVDRRRGLGGVPRVARRAVALVREAAPGTLRTAVALQVASAALLAAQLYVVKHLAVALIRLGGEDGAPVGDLVPSVVALVLVTLLLGLAAALLERQQRMLAELVGRHTLDRIIDVAAGVELARFEAPSFYDQLERATNAASFRPVEMVNALMGLVLAVLTGVAVLVVLLALEPLLVPFVLLAAVPILLATLRNSRAAYAFEYAMTTHARERLHLLELFVDRDVAKELRVFDATAFLRRRYDALSDERIRRVRSFLAGRLRVALTGALAGALGGAVALAALVLLLSADRIDVAAAATAAVAMQVLAGRLSTVTSTVGKLVESGLFLDDLGSFLALGEATAAGPPAPRRPEPGPFESLRVEGLSFAYPGTTRRVLEDVSLEVNRGEVVALVGENGSGKTTLVKVLCQLYGHDAGSVRWNGTEVAELHPRGLRGEMTVLFQDFVRYQLSVSDNVVLGRSDVPVDPERVREAARQAGAEEAIERFPHGYETRLGRRFLGGHELSGGQWQRLALARSFYRGGGFLVMDEPTAALDPRAEYALFEQIRGLAAGKSVLLISHRFANVRMADRIYVLDGGRVVESGDHAALMARDGLYAELFGLQAAAYAGPA